MPRITPPPDPPAPPGPFRTTTHAICQATLAIEAALDSCCDANAIYLSTAEKRDLLLRMPLLQARFAELNYRVLACAEDVADAHGARDVGDYVAHETRQAHGTLARELRAARELDTRWRVLQEALRGGRSTLPNPLRSRGR